MKKLAVFGFIMVTLFSCVSKKSADKTAAEKDSLAVALSQKDSLLNDVFFSLNEISENLDAIKTREKIVTSNATGEIDKEVKVQILEDVQAIDELLQQNRETIKNLQSTSKKLRKANVKIGQLETLVENMTKQIEAKDKEIATLKVNLEKLDFKVGELNSKVANLNQEVSSLNQSNSTLSEQVADQHSQLNTAYYIIGTEKELLAKAIIVKSGFLAKELKINGKYDLDNFTRINVKHVNEILIGQRKVTLVSSHPEGSYELVTTKKGFTDKIIITDPAKFWETSKILVISYR